MVGPRSLFPALHRFAERGWIEGQKGELESKRRAKFYTLTRSAARAVLRTSPGNHQKLAT